MRTDGAYTFIFEINMCRSAQPCSKRMPVPMAYSDKTYISLFDFGYFYPPLGFVLFLMTRFLWQNRIIHPSEGTPVLHHDTVMAMADNTVVGSFLLLRAVSHSIMSLIWRYEHGFFFTLSNSSISFYWHLNHDTEILVFINIMVSLQKMGFEIDALHHEGAPFSMK